MNELEQKLGELFGKLPALPEGVSAFLVKIAPWLAVISVVLSIPAILAILGLNGAFGAYGVYGYGTVGIIFLVANVILTGLAIPGLFARTRAGWNFTFWSVLVGGVENIVMFNLGGLIIGLGIGLYILFQVRRYYS